MKAISWITLAAAIVLLQGIAPLKADEEYTKKISKSFQVNKDATLEVVNKFGDIYCENWTKNEVSIEVTITVEAPSEDKADKYFDKISIDIEGNASRVSAVTSIDENAFGKGNHEFSIDYSIRMPASLSVELDNKFGDLFIEEVTGNSDINLAYGHIRAGRLAGTVNKLDMAFSEGQIGYLGTTDAEIKYCEVTIDEATSISGVTKFSELDIKKAGVISVESGYDEQTIGTVSDLNVDGKFSEIRVELLENHLKADLGYGEIRIDEIMAGFSLVELENSFTDATLVFSADASFSLDAEVKMGDISYPKSNSSISEEEVTYTTSRYRGTVGSDTDPSSRVVIEVRNSDVKISIK